MKVTVQNLIIDMDMVLKPTSQVWLWEVPVLQEIHGESRVRLLDTAEIEVAGLPDVAEVFARLLRKYGADSGEGGTNVTYVEIAYGRGKAGKDALQKLITKSTKRKRKAKKKTAAKEPEPTFVEVVEEGEGDPLDMG
jgi:hypothetical protein